MNARYGLRRHGEARSRTSDLVADVRERPRRVVAVRPGAPNPGLVWFRAAVRDSGTQHVSTRTLAQLMVT